MTTTYRHPYTWWDERLEREGRQKTADGFKAKCPAHDDDGPSLHVTRKKSTSTPPVLYCFAGCAYTAIERAAREGRTETEGPRLTRRASKTSAPDPVPREWIGRGFEWYAEYTGLPIEFLRTQDLKVDREHVLFTFPHNGIAKTRRIGTKQITWNKPGAYSPPLWPMPEDELPKTIYLTEGESDCLILRFLGYDAYAVTKGAKGRLPKAIWRLLLERGVRHIGFVFDQDTTGEEGLEQHQEDATEVGLTTSSHRARLRLMEGEKDLRDWYLRTGGEGPVFEDDAEDEFAMGLDDLAASNPPLSWITQGLFAHEALTLVAGPPKAGKTSLLSHFLHCHERGDAFLGEPTTKGRALLMTEEFAPTIIEKAAHFDVRHLSVFTQTEAARRGWDFPNALNRAVEKARREKRDVLIIDTLAAWAQFKDENDASEVTRAMTLVRNAVAGTGLCVILIHHVRKGGGEHGEAIRGSSALFAIPEITIEYSYKERTTREVSIHSRPIGAPEPFLVRMNERGQLERLDNAEWAEEEARPILEALKDGAKDMAGLIEATSLSDTTIRKHIRELEHLDKVETTIGARGKKTYVLRENARDGGVSARVNVRRVKAKEPRERPDSAGTRPARTRQKGRNLR